MSDSLRPLSMGFSRQEYWSEFLFPSPGDLPNPGVKPGSPTLQADASSSEPPGKPINSYYISFKKKMALYSSSRVWNEETSSSLSTFWIPSCLQKHLHLPYVCMYQGLSQVNLFVTQQTVAHQASLSMEFSRQEYWSGLPFPSPGNLPNPGTEPGSPAL